MAETKLDKQTKDAKLTRPEKYIGICRSRLYQKPV